MRENRIDYDDHGDLDDIVIDKVTLFHMEWMDSGQVWIRLHREGEKDVVFWLNSEQKIEGRHDFVGNDVIDVPVNQ